MATELDYMEYSSDALAQAAYVSNMVGVLDAYSESTIKTQGSYSLKGTASTDALSKTLTHYFDGTGGTITHVGGYTIHTFTTGGTFNPGKARDVEYLIVAAGGGGGRNFGGNSTAGGGGGGGGVLTGSDTVSSGDLAVVVGAGGAGSSTNSVRGGDGGNSSFNGHTATGGGGGGSYPTSAGRAGGSGGGSSYGATKGSGTAGQGYDGGVGSTAGVQGGGGGGGAGEAGANGSSSAGGNGGNGTASSISGSSVTYAGGGGGGYAEGIGAGTGGTGGAGGGGNGVGNATAGSGTDGLGGGGGGGATGGNGGSGIVIIRYLSETIDLSGVDTLRLDIRASRTGSNIKIGIRDSGGTTTEITPNIISADVYQTVTWDISGVTNANKDAIDRIIITVVNADAANTFYVDGFVTAENVTITAEPFIVTSTLSSDGAVVIDGYGFIYEEDSSGAGMDVSLRTGQGVGKNLYHRKCIKYIYHRINTHGKDVTMTVYIDGVAQSPTFTINTTTLVTRRIEDVPAWEGYKFDIGLSCEDVTDTDLEIHKPLAVQYTQVGD